MPVQDRFKYFTDAQRLIGLYCDGEERSPEFLKTGQIEEIFHEVGKHFSLRQRLKSIASMGDISGDKFFKTTTGTSSGIRDRE